MRWYRDLTARQRTILLALAWGVVLVVGALVWSVTSTLRASQRALSVTVDPSAAFVTPVPTPRPTETPQPTPTATPTFDVTRAGTVALRVSEARQTLGGWGVPVTLVGSTGMARALYRHFRAWPLVLPLRAQGVLQMVHQWPWEKLRLDAVGQSHQVAAFYAPESGDLYLRRDWAGEQDLLLAQVAYGYARAVPDQVGDIIGLMKETSSLDQQLALAALAEGDAWVTLQLVQGASVDVGEATSLEMWARAAVCPWWQMQDDALEALSCLPFDLGRAFAVARFRGGGLRAMDKALQRPPRSTEQLLHPERYAAHDEPLVLIPLEPELDAGWVLTQSETVGEALIGLILARWERQEASVWAGIPGWGGDLMQIWEDGTGQRVAAWHFAWDTSQAAVAFYRRLLDVLPRALVPGLMADTTTPFGLPRGHWWAGRQGAVFAYRRGAQVWLIWGADGEAVREIASVIP